MFESRLLLSASAVFLISILSFPFFRSKFSRSHRLVAVPHFPPLLRCVANRVKNVKLIGFQTDSLLIFSISPNEYFSLELNSSSFPVSSIAESEISLVATVDSYSLKFPLQQFSHSTKNKFGIEYFADSSTGSIYSREKNEQNSPIYRVHVDFGLNISSISTDFNGNLLVSYEFENFFDVFLPDFSQCYRVKLPFSNCNSIISRDSSKDLLVSDPETGCIWEIQWNLGN